MTNRAESSACCKCSTPRTQRSWLSWRFVSLPPVLTAPLLEKRFWLRKIRDLTNQLDAAFLRDHELPCQAHIEAVEAAAIDLRGRHRQQIERSAVRIDGATLRFGCFPVASSIGEVYTRVLELQQVFAAVRKRDEWRWKRTRDITCAGATSFRETTGPAGRKACGTSGLQSS